MNDINIKTAAAVIDKKYRWTGSPPNSESENRSATTAPPIIPVEIPMKILDKDFLISRLPFTYITSYKKNVTLRFKYLIFNYYQSVTVIICYSHNRSVWALNFFF